MIYVWNYIPHTYVHISYTFWPEKTYGLWLIDQINSTTTIPGFLLIPSLQLATQWSTYLKAPTKVRHLKKTSTGMLCRGYIINISGKVLQLKYFKTQGKKQIIEDIRHKGDLPCSLVSKINILKLVILSKVIWRFSDILLKFWCC